MEEEQKGITIGEIFKIIFNRIWWVVGVTAAVLVVFACVVQFWYNPEHQTYTVSYEVRLPSGNSYPDGTALQPDESVLLANLQLIKDESFLPEEQRTGKFKSINIAEMVEEDDIRYSQKIEQNQDGSYKYVNYVSIVKKYFKDEKQAAAFVKAVAEYPVLKAQSIVEKMNYSSRLAKYDIVTTYEEKINALVEQKNYISSAYNNLLTTYGGEYVPAGLTGGKCINDYINDLAAIFNLQEQAAVRDDIALKYYFFDVESRLKALQSEVEFKNREIANNESIIDGLYEEMDKVIGKVGDVTVKEIAAFSERINYYREENEKLQNRIDEIGEIKKAILDYTEGDGVQAKQAFDARLDEIKVQLDESTQVLKSVNVCIYDEKTQVVYENNKIEAEGGFNIILATIIGAVIGFLLVGVVVFIKDYPKYKREKLASQEAQKAGDGSVEKTEEDAEAGANESDEVSAGKDVKESGEKAEEPVAEKSAKKKSK